MLAITEGNQFTQCTTALHARDPAGKEHKVANTTSKLSGFQSNRAPMGCVRQTSLTHRGVTLQPTTPYESSTYVLVIDTTRPPRISVKPLCAPVAQGEPKKGGLMLMDLMLLLICVCEM